MAEKPFCALSQIRPLAFCDVFAARISIFGNHRGRISVWDSSGGIRIKIHAQTG